MVFAQFLRRENKLSEEFSKRNPSWSASEDLELAGTIVWKKTSNALNRCGLYARTPDNTLLAKVYCATYGQACKMLGEYSLIRWDQNWKLCFKGKQHNTSAVNFEGGNIIAWGCFSATSCLYCTFLVQGSLNMIEEMTNKDEKTCNKTFIFIILPSTRMMDMKQR